ncbi:sensor histidine kinase [Actinoplanes derwentensis]|uniref:sensor histidine kinase n=1 Tax=Actinoplanes derwentensis TaxID=113562 RepID=UPI001E5173D9|nr:histidine kinase [Actinoplanes derwentensis]
MPWRTAWQYGEVERNRSDRALGGMLAVVAVAGTVAAGRSAVPVDITGCVLVAVAALALTVRRSRPLVSLVVAALCTGVYLAVGYPYGPVVVVFMIAVYSAARHAKPRDAVLVASAALMLLLVHLLVSDRDLGWLGVVPVAAWVVVPGALGHGLRLREQSARQARAEALAGERLRIAQEVHDVVGHGLAAIKMQADIALHMLHRRPGQAEVALTAISETSEQALAELRAALAAVRGHDLVAGLARLDDLRRRMAEAGVVVRVHVTGDHVPAMPAAVDLAGYRIVQESLTNVLRHGHCEKAEVLLRYAGDSLTITIANPLDGDAGTSPGVGSGIAGMRARVQALGGEFMAGRYERRFEVRARLPFGGVS